MLTFKMGEMGVTEIYNQTENTSFSLYFEDHRGWLLERDESKIDIKEKVKDKFPGQKQIYVSYIDSILASFYSLIGMAKTIKKGSDQIYAIPGSLREEQIDSDSLITFLIFKEVDLGCASIISGTNNVSQTIIFWTDEHAIKIYEIKGKNNINSCIKIDLYFKNCDKNTYIKFAESSYQIIRNLDNPKIIFHKLISQINLQTNVAYIYKYNDDVEETIKNVEKSIPLGFVNASEVYNITTERIENGESKHDFIEITKIPVLFVPHLEIKNKKACLYKGLNPYKDIVCEYTDTYEGSCLVSKSIIILE